jgi:hypothetical protein
MIMVKTIKLQWPKTDLVNILRWEDDGGTSTESKTSVPDWHFIQPVPTAGVHVTSLQWNERFVIEPFQAGTRIGWRAGKAPNKK